MDTWNGQSISSNQRAPLVWVADWYLPPDLFTWWIQSAFGPSARVVSFQTPEALLEELKRAGEPPDVVVSAFYFDGGYRNGLWLIQEARKLYEQVPTILTSGYPAEHVARAASDWEVKPDLILYKGDEFFWTKLTEQLKEFLTLPRARRAELQGTQDDKVADRNVAPAPTLKTRMPRRRARRGRPLVYFICPSDALNTLKRCMGRSVQPSRFHRGYDWEHFEVPESAWAKLQSTRTKPEAVVADYYLAGGSATGLTVVREAQRLCPGIWTVLVSWFAEDHVGGMIEGTGITPDLSIYCENYRC
jgi:hypothetical protein